MQVLLLYLLVCRPVAPATTSIFSISPTIPLAVAIVSIIMAYDAEPKDYNGNIGSVFPAMAADGEGWSAGHQAKAQLYGLLVRKREYTCRLCLPRGFRVCVCLARVGFKC